MKTKTRNWIIAGAAALIIVGFGGRALLNNYLGNKVEIQQVIEHENETANASANKAADQENTNDGQVLSGEELNGEWIVEEPSKIYFSVTTSKETVNFENEAVYGTWTIDLSKPTSMKAEGSMDLDAINSGNGQRDEHIKSPDYFDIAQFPEATFSATNFEGLPVEWEEGTNYNFTMSGIMNIRGIDKEVTFTGKFVYQNEQLKISAETIVTFADFGMENPHNLVVSTENDIKVQLQLVLKR